MERILGKLLGLFFTIALVRYKNKTYMYSKFGLTRKAREKAIYKTLQEAKSDMYTRNNTECKRKRDLNEEKAYYEGLGYQVFNNGAFSYEALRLLQNGSVNRSLNKEYSLQELLDMKD